MTATVQLAVSEIHAVGQAALRRAGVPAESAGIQLSLLLHAELRGVSSHGLLRLPRILERLHNGVTHPTARGSVTWRGEALAEVDGGQGLGPVVAVTALDALMGKIREHGVAVAAIRNCDHLGALAYYAERIAKQGKILLGLTISEALVHPWGGRQAMIGTNPIAIGVPNGGEPFVVDLATSQVSMGKIHDHANRNMPIPPGLALDADGHPTTDPHAAKSGALAPFGAAKGYALGLGFELLVGALTGCALGRDVTGTLDSTRLCNKGDVFIMLEPAHGAHRAIATYLEAIRQCPPQEGCPPVRVPGDRAREMARSRQREGVTLPAAVWQAVTTFAAG